MSNKSRTELPDLIVIRTTKGRAESALKVSGKKSNLDWEVNKDG